MATPVAQANKAIEEMFKKLQVADNADAQKAATNDLAKYVQGTNQNQDALPAFYESLKKMLANSKDQPAVNKGLETIKDIAANASNSPSIEPYLVHILPSVLAVLSQKAPAAKAKAAGPKLDNVRTAKDTVEAISKIVNPNSVKAVIPHLAATLTNLDAKWPEKMAALVFIGQLSESAKPQTAFCVHDLIPAVSAAMWDTKPEIKKAAYATMERICKLISNADINKFIPEVIACIAKPPKVPDTIHSLGATTFVADVHESALALMVPLLKRGLSERETAIRRKSAVIIDNMCKLVEDPTIVAAFLPELLPALKECEISIADPEANGKIKQALATLRKVGQTTPDDKPPTLDKVGDILVVEKHLRHSMPNKHEKIAKEEKYDPVLNYAAALAAYLVEIKETSDTAWRKITPYLAGVTGSDAQSIVDVFRTKALPGLEDKDEILSDEEEGEDLCNCEFNLAYGAKILLNQTKLRLKRGHRYGILGPNGSGKTTLMRAINNEQVEGFPKQTEVRTVYVEHDLDAADTEQTVVGWTMKKLSEKDIKTSQQEVENRLREFGFNDIQLEGFITALSGGWKMKLALARAVFFNPDILLLDEPTNHMDVKNVKWLEDYLTNSPCTSLIISHDSGFLNNVIQHVIHYEGFKLKRYRGNLDKFAEKRPNLAKAYLSLDDTEGEFKFPEPGYLEGVKTKKKAIIRTTDMKFKYPGQENWQLENITFQVSLDSRIAIIGPNGAGKSTLANLITGEMVLEKGWGDIWSHENIRIAYIKQHAFAHIDHHLEKTPSEYIQWRFQTGEDRETLDRASSIVTQDDEALMNTVYRVNETQRRIISVHDRKKLQNSYQYEVSYLLGENVGMKNERWTPMSTSENGWHPRSELLRTHAKLVAEVDKKVALASGQFRQLVRAEIESHCAEFGLEAELVSHSRMLGLSGGQRVKVCLAACTWQRPHVIVLDEPTNYLDRDSLGALSKALKKFEGGVIIITHSSEFTKGLTSEVWAVQDGTMSPSGHNWVKGQGDGPRIEKKEAEDTFDAMGNKIDATQEKKKLTSKELRAKRKDRILRKKRGEEVLSDDE